MRACPHCNSPSRGNPCWYKTQGGADSPCEVDRYNERMNKRDKREGRLFMGIFVFFVLAILGIGYVAL